MAVKQLPSGAWQARLQGSDKRIMSRTFPTKAEALKQDADWKLAKAGGGVVTGISGKLTVAEFFETWFKDRESESSQSGWRKTQAHYFRDYILPVIGNLKLRAVTPATVTRIFARMTEAGFSPRTQVLVYGTLRKFFGDAIETYQILTFNPVIRKLRPKEPTKEVPYLNLEQARKLLTHVRGKRFGLGIWIQTYLGLRAGELFELRWKDIDLESGRLVIRRVFVKSTKTVRDYPKDRRQRSYTVPPELADYLRETAASAGPETLVLNELGERVVYQTYLVALVSYCSELGLPILGSHGLRHSSALLYLTHGANKEDLKDGLFQHSSMKVTERYVHGWESKIGNVAKVIRLFDSTTNRPRGSVGSGSSC